MFPLFLKIPLLGLLFLQGFQGLVFLVIPVAAFAMISTLL